MILDSLKKAQSFSAKALCNYLVTIDDKEIISDEVFEQLFSFVDVNKIQDSTILKNERIKSKINWNHLERFKLIRILSRDISILENVDVKPYKYSLMELYPLFLMYPGLVDYFDVDFDSLSWIEAIKMLECSDEFIDRIDLSKYNINKTQSLELIKKFFKNEKILNQVDLYNLEDNFILRKLLKKTGDKYINKLNLNHLKVADWLDVLETRPELLEHCNLLLFETNDCYNLIKLVEFFPHLDYLIESNKNKISALGWERLLIRNFEKYEKICVFNKLTKKNWDNILEKRPNLENIMKRYF